MMGKLFQFKAGMKPPPKKTPPKVRTERVSLKVRRGVIAGLLTSDFLADMCGVNRNTMRRLFYDEMKRKGIKPKQMKPRQVGQFIEFVAQLRKNKNSDRLKGKLF